MLQIYLYGPNEQGFLDIPDGSRLELEDTSDAFDEDLTVGTFSIPQELPWTPNNKRLTGFAERLENSTGFANLYKVDVYNDGWLEIVSGQLQILEKSGSFSYKRGKFNVTITGTKGLFGTLIYNKKMTSLQLGGVISWTGMDCRTFATNHMKGLTPQYGYIGFAPVAIENYFDKNRPDYNNEFLAKDTVNCIVVTGSNSDDWQFARPQSSNPLLPTIPGTAEHVDFRTIPFFQFKFVLKKVFEEFGFTVSGDFVGDTDFDDLFLFNNCSLEHYSNYSDTTQQIVPANHFDKDLLISDFLKNALSFFNLKMTFTGSNTVTLRYRVKDITQRNPLSITTDKIVDEFESTIDISNQNKGYKIAAGFDSNDQYHGDRVKQITLKENNVKWVGDKIWIATVANVASLQTLNIGRQITTADCVLVQIDNLFYSLADGTTTPKKWDVYAENLQDYEQRNAKGDEATRSIPLGMAPLCTYVEFNETTGLKEKRNYVGASMPGTYINSYNTKVTNPFGLSIFYIKKQIIEGVNLPVSFNGNTDSNGVSAEKYSLSLNGNKGIVQAFHSQWQNLLEKAETVKTSLVMDNKLKQELKTYSQLEIAGVLYLQQKSEPSIPQLEPMVVYLIPL